MPPAPPTFPPLSLEPHEIANSANAAKGIPENACCNGIT
jgi:hypothetical protein